jgi:hypothetical protein
MAAVSFHDLESLYPQNVEENPMRERSTRFAASVIRQQSNDDNDDITVNYIFAIQIISHVTKFKIFEI